MKSVSWIVLGTIIFSSPVWADEVMPLRKSTATVPLLGQQQGDLFELLSTEIVGDVLVVQVRYHGGCAVHRWDKSWWNGFRESSPVQADVGLIHDAGRDRCKEKITEDLHFDLSDMKTVYQKAYRTDHGAIRVGVRGFQQPIPRTRNPAGSVGHRFGDPSPEPINKVLGGLYQF